MSRVCDMCGKRPGMGYSISHAHNRTKRRNLPNLQKIRISDGGRIRQANLCTRCIRTGKFEKAV